MQPPPVESSRFRVVDGGRLTATSNNTNSLDFSVPITLLVSTGRLPGEALLTALMTIIWAIPGRGLPVQYWH